MNSFWMVTSSLMEQISFFYTIKVKCISVACILSAGKAAELWQEWVWAHRSHLDLLSRKQCSPDRAPHSQGRERGWSRAHKPGHDHCSHCHGVTSNPTRTTAALPTQRQTQDSGTSGQGPKQTSAKFNNVVFTPVLVFFALVLLASPKFILEFKDDWSSLSDLDSRQEKSPSFKLVSPENSRLPVPFQNLHGQVLFQENAWW